jgi:hypothetical protein
MIVARSRLLTVGGAIALTVLAAPAAALAQDGASGASDSGGKDAGESASAWSTGGWLLWTVIVIALLGVLILALVLNARGGDDPGAQAADERPAGPGETPVPPRPSA